jgi:hypothetical protein
VNLAVVEAFRPFDDIYRQSSGVSPLAEAAERLAAAAPVDAGRVTLEGYRGLRPPWTSWTHVAGLGHSWAGVLARVALEGA